MNQFNQLIILLYAIQQYSKDIHYSVRGIDFYSQHLLADRIYDPISDWLDSIKEECLLFEAIAPLPSSIYLKESAEIIPERTTDDLINWNNMRDLHIKTLTFIEKMGNLSVGEANLIGGIAETLNDNLGLLNLLCEKVKVKNE